MTAFPIGDSRFSIIDYGKSIRFLGDDGGSNQLQKTSPVGMDFNKTGSFTIRGRIKFPTDESRANKIWRKDNSGVSGYTLIFEKSGANHVFDFQEATVFTNDTFVLPNDDFLNKWHDFCLTVQGNSSSSVTTKFYWDGIQITTKTSNITWLNAVADNSSTLRLGDEFHTDCPDCYMDEIQYYDRVLEQYEARQCMFHKSYINDGHLKGYWKMDEGSGSTVADSSGTGNTLTINGSTSFSADVFMSNPSRPITPYRVTPRLTSPYSILCNGATSKSAITSVAAQDGLSACTIAAYIKVYGLGGSNAGRIFQKGPNAVGYIDLGCNSNGIICQFDWSGTDAQVTYNYTNFNRAMWNHFLITYSGVSGQAPKMYLNGALLTPSLQAGGSGSRNADSNAIAIANRTIDAGRSFAGLISDVQLYNRELTTDEAPLVHLAGKTFNGLVGRWKCDEGTGTTLTDYINGANGANSNISYDTDSFINAVRITI